MSLLNQKKLESALFYCDYRKGTILDEVTGNEPSTTSNSSWGTGKRGKGILQPTTGSSNEGIIYPALSQAYPEKTIFVLFERLTPHITRYNELFCTGTTGDTFMLILDEGEFGVWEYGGSSFLSSGKTIPLGSVNVLAVRQRSGVKSSLFVNGVRQADVDFEPNGSSPADFGIKTNDSNAASGGITYFAAIFDEVMTNEEIAKISEELLATHGMGDPKTSNFKFPVPKVKDSTLVIHTDFTKNSDGELVDLSGNGNTADTLRMASVAEPPFGNAVRSREGGADFGAMSAKASLTIGTNDFSYGVWFKPVAISGTRFLIAAYYGQPRFYIRLSSTGGNIRCSDGTHDEYKAFTFEWGLNQWHHVVATVKKGEVKSLYINGDLKETLDISDVGSMTTDNLLMIGAYGDSLATSASYLDASYADFRFYNGKALSATEVKNWYNEYATKLKYTSDSKKWLPTLANVTAEKIGNTDFTRGAGTWKVNENSDGKKLLESVASGEAYKPSNQAYGTWVFRFNSNDHTNIAVFISDLKTYSGSSSNGYGVYTLNTGVLTLAKRTSGSFSGGIITSSASGTIDAEVDYKVAVTRSLTGVWRMYIKGGDYDEWTQVGGGGTENTFTTSKYCVLDVTAGDSVDLLGTHLGVLGINELSQLY